jgi:hypothetical protein
MAGPVQAIGQRLGENHRKLNGMDPHRLNPYARTPNSKILLRLINFRIRL